MAAPKKLEDLKFIDFDKKWKVPTAKGMSMNFPQTISKSRQDFINEYYPSGHKIYDTTIYPDLFYKIKQSSKLGKAVSQQYNGMSAYKKIPRKRISVPIQQDATRAILSHIFGNPIVHKDISPIKDDKSKEKIAIYKNLWKYYNMDNHIRNFFGRSMICGDSALFLTINKRKEIECKTLSFLDDDKLAIQQDRTGEVLKIFRQYTSTNEKNEKETFIDVISANYIATYNSEGDLINEQSLYYSFIPAVYHYRKDGAWWSFVQPNIDEYEIELSDLAQDNKTKAKGKYFMSTTNPEKVRLESFANSDVFVADRYSDMKFLEPTSFSDAFKFTIEENKEIITRDLAFIFPKVQNSGDLPTGSMKAQFYPAERICMEFINEFAPILDEISWIFQQLVDTLYPDLHISEMKISSKIKLFSPTDNLTSLSVFSDSISKGGATPRSAVDNNPAFLDDEDLEYLETMQEEKMEIERSRYNKK